MNKWWDVWDLLVEFMRCQRSQEAFEEDLERVARLATMTRADMERKRDEALRAGRYYGDD